MAEVAHVTDPWEPRVVWQCPKPGCEYRLNESGPESDPVRDDEARRRAITRAREQHYTATHGNDRP